MLIIKQGKVGLFHCHTEMPINGSSLNRALPRVDSLRGGLAEGNRITSQRLLDQSPAGVYMGKTPHTPPFGPIRVPYPKGLNC